MEWICLMSRPSIIFLDAVGTLFGVRGTVGEIYSQFASEVGVEVDPHQLNKAFMASFCAAPKAAFLGVEPADLSRQELDWWQEIARQSFAQMGVLAQFTDFDLFFQRLFAHFATPAPWFVYADVPQALVNWQDQGITLGVISNFDSRLYAVLEGLDLSPYFTSVTISTVVGVAKPDAQIFATALAHHDCPAQAAWHIGDSWQDDYDGATQAGLRGIWLNREHQAPPAPAQTEISDLLALAGASTQ